MLKEWNEKMKGEVLDTEIAAMEKIVNLALREMEVYEKYSDALKLKKQAPRVEKGVTHPWRSIQYNFCIEY